MVAVVTHVGSVRVRCTELRRDDLPALSRSWVFGIRRVLLLMLWRMKLGPSRGTPSLDWRKGDICMLIITINSRPKNSIARYKEIKS